MILNKFDDALLALRNLLNSITLAMNNKSKKNEADTFLDHSLAVSTVCSYLAILTRSISYDDLVLLHRQVSRVSVENFETYVFTLLFIHSRYIISILNAQIFLTRHSTNCRAIYFAPAQYLPKDPLISFSAAVSYLSSITSRANLYMKIVLSYSLVIRKQLVLLPLLSSLNMLERDN